MMSPVANKGVGHAVGTHLDVNTASVADATNDPNGPSVDCIL